MKSKLHSAINQKIHLKSADVQLFVKREDCIHPQISGNKYRKLKYNLQQAKNENKQSVLTFGGAYSNHIAATAYAGQLHGFDTVGVIRGEELQSQVSTNPTLRYAQSCGMQFHFVSRTAYRLKTTPELIEHLRSIYGDFYLLPEGGTNDLAIKGCEEILSETDKEFDYICCAVGTGGTLSGLINASQPHQTLLGFPALKGDFLQKDIRKFAIQNNWDLIPAYHFGGYGKINTRLITFINEFKTEHQVLLDPVYTGKMMYGVMEMIAQGYFPKGSNLLAIHTGGIQGIAGMNQVLKQKNLPLINECQ
jgi:1-aminocyclopropane-1-carboxylate deaminase